MIFAEQWLIVNYILFCMEYKLSAKKREQKGEKARERGLLPAVVYGANQANFSLALDYNGFAKLYAKVGASSLIELSVDGQADGKILIHDVQYDPISGRISHVDLRRIDMNKEITTTVVLNFINESPAIKEQGGTLIKNIEEVEVKCLPKDLVAEISVDLVVLKTFTDVIKVKDLPVPAGLVIISPRAEDIVVKAVPALTEEQIKAMEEDKSDVTKVEVAGAKEEAEAGEEKKAEGDIKGEKKKEPAEKKEQK